MPYEITPHDFCLIVKNPRCQGQEITNGFAKEGGECNYGGRHKMTDDLRQINQNFRAFDVLVKQQVKLSKSKNESEFNNSKKSLLNSFQSLKTKCEDEGGTGFFYGSCIGLDEETDPVKKAQLFALLSQKNQEIKNLQSELKKDPVYSLYSQEKNDELANIVKNIFQGEGSFFKWKKRSDEEPKGQKSEKYLGFIPKETGKNALLIVGGLLGL
ncbi:43641_t:CDS:2 [Gigaspora margarita]|uniref:43641_t:CDS:1 n=1 Tax=Gigaspora margarita TaxID=4874 RepID=A0ABN7UYJ8_GIGMA|nr:43641_t:CDS:2 [Gigaspora margarita]